MLVGDYHFSDESVDLACAALIASGVRHRYDLETYLGKVEQLCRQIRVSREANEIEKARCIFRWLWRSRPTRWVRHGNFRLTAVLDAQLSEHGPVGNCLGLTILYNILAQRYGLRVQTGYVDEAFGVGPHVFTVLYTPNRSIDIENMFPHGFDYDPHLANDSRQEWGDRHIIAEIHHSLANQVAEEGRWRDAIKSYDRALKLNPGHLRARLNKGIALVELGMTDQAKWWFAQEAGEPSDGS